MKHQNINKEGKTILYQLYIGQVLRTTTEENVVVRKIFNDEISVEYKGKIYQRPKSIIGKKLFFMHYDKVSIKDKVKEPLRETYTCNDCRLKIRDDCYGEKKICKDFKFSPRNRIYGTFYR